MHFVFPHLFLLLFCHFCLSAFNVVSSCNYGRNCVLSGTTTYLRCYDIAESFSDEAELYKGFMSFFTECIHEEESIYRPACVGYRVFLPACLGVSSFLVAQILHSTITLQPFNDTDSLLLFTKLNPLFYSTGLAQPCLHHRTEKSSLSPCCIYQTSG
jgi:hypothetical protein